MRKYVGILVILLLIIVFVQGKAMAKDAEIVAKFGDKKITVAEFEKILGYVDSERQKLLEKNPQLKEAFLKQIVQSMVIADLAKKKGFDKEESVKDQLKLFSDSFLANEYLKKEVASKITVSDDNMKLYYDSHKDEFKTPEMVRARHILVRVDASASESDKKKAKERAEEILKKIKSDEDFVKLASEMSDDPGSKSKGGDLGFFPRGRMIKPFEDAAFSQKPGEISDVIETQFGYHIIRVEEKKDEAIETFDAVKERINQKLLQDQIKSKLTDFVEKAMKDAKVEMYPEVITGEKK